MLVVPRFDHCRLLLLRSGDECLDANNALSVLTAGAQLFISRRPVNIRENSQIAGGKRSQTENSRLFNVYVAANTGRGT